MAKTTQQKVGKKSGRVEVKDFKKPAQELTKDERRRIKGGELQPYGGQVHPHLWTQAPSTIDHPSDESDS